MAKNETATLAGGCFWCTEAIYKRLKGVISVTSGYAGGGVEHPNYEQVSSGSSGHAETIQLVFDPQIITYEKILNIFFAVHDPTTKNRQGSDEGAQYRSMIFYHNETQRKTAENIIVKLANLGHFYSPIVTKLAPFVSFYPAEHYHQNYYEKNKDLPYCQLVINPKIKRLIEEFRNDVKEEYL